MKAVFLDRDGVINRAIVKSGKPHPPASLQELEIPSEVLPALNQLKRLGFMLIGVTNQPDVARGTTSKTVVESINEALLKQLPVDTILVCYHDDADACNCRKPNPGLLLQAATEYKIDLRKSFMIGDRWRDVLAGQKAGCKTIWINYGYDEQKPDSPTHTVANLAEAVNWILEQCK